MNEDEEKLNNALKLLARKDIDLVRTIIDSDGNQYLRASEKAYDLKTKICRDKDIQRFSQRFFEQDGASPTRENLITFRIEFIVMCIVEQTNIKGYLKKHKIKNVDEEAISKALVSLFLLDAKREGFIDL